MLRSLAVRIGGDDAGGADGEGGGAGEEGCGDGGGLVWMARHLRLVLLGMVMGLRELFL